MSGVTGPCEWPLLFPRYDCSALNGLDFELRDVVESAATSILWRWTGGQFGLCEVTVRPCRPDFRGRSTWQGRTGAPTSRAGAIQWAPVLIGGEWFNLTCGCGKTCKCDGLWTIRLPGPVDSVVDVQVDGTSLPVDAYRVDGRGLLTRQDGEEWPSTQDLDRPDGDDGTFSVTYMRGLPVPAGGQLAAAVLACELAAAYVGEDCRLPQRVQTITREGVTVGVVDSFDDLDAGKTGIWTIDSWVASVVSSPKRSVVLTPDGPTVRRQTWP